MHLKCVGVVVVIINVIRMLNQILHISLDSDVEKSVRLRTY